jgi:hypothetical protein
MDKDPSAIEEYFSDSIVYSECYGPEYRGKEQCLRWFKDWNNKGSVLAWEIKNITSIKDTCFVEWHFGCDYENKIAEFDGVSIIKFKDGKIIQIKEFQSKSEHYFPYE